MEGMERSRRSRRSFASMLLTATLVFSPVFSGAEEGAVAAGEKDVRSAPVQIRTHDLRLLDQDGRSLRFAADVVGDRVVVIDTFFTSCGLICPILGAIFADLQEQLGERLERDVRLVSISVDPRTDIPPRLKKYSEQWEARPGWLFLTGEKKVVDRVLDGLGMYTADFTDHPSAFLVGDARSGKWTRFYGFATPDQLMGKVRELLAERKAGGS